MRGSIEGLGLLCFSFAVGCFAVGSVAVGCSSSSSTFGSDDGGGGGGGPSMDGNISLTPQETGTLGPQSDGGLSVVDSSIPQDAYFAMDPPLMYCGVEAGAQTPITGSAMCPSDKNREGCPCDTPGMTAPCWPGLRADRDIGQCKDGTTTCISNGEALNQVWGACQGYVLPTAGATAGSAACKCFSSGTWAIANVEPCTYTFGSQTGDVSTIEADGGIGCPPFPNMMPPTTAPAVWSTDTLQVDCEGQFKLCFTVKAGDPNNKMTTDCVVGQSCVSGDYTQANATQAFPPLPGWLGTDAACAAKFAASGGYGEMSVQGVSEYCEPIGADDGGAPMVFNTLPYCGPDAGASCQSGGSGGFGQ
jgi:hypothetical protein